MEIFSSLIAMLAASAVLGRKCTNYRQDPAGVEEIFNEVKPEAENEWTNIEIVENENLMGFSRRRKRDTGLLKSLEDRKKIMKMHIHEENEHNSNESVPWCAKPTYIDTLDEYEFEEAMTGVSLDFSHVNETAGPEVPLPRPPIVKRGTEVDLCDRTGPVESQSHAMVGMYNLEYGKSIDGSEEQLTMCSYKGRTSCKNGHTFEAFNFASRSPFVSENDYEKKKSRRRKKGGFFARLFGTVKRDKKGCDEQKFKYSGKPRVDGWKWTEGHGVNAINAPADEKRADAMKALLDAGQLVTIYMQVSKGGFRNFDKGVWDYDGDCKDVNHAMVVCGYGTDPEGGRYWKIKNSWGKAFGDNGYIKVKAYKNLCNCEALGHRPIAKHRH